MPDPNQETILDIKLPLRLVNVVLSALAKQPLEVSIDAFVAVKNQADQQLVAAQAATQLAAAPNGKDAAH